MTPDTAKMVERLNKLVAKTGRDYTTGHEFVHGAGSSQVIVDAIREAAALIASLAEENEILKAAIFGGDDYDTILTVGCFAEMARTAETARKGACDRALAAEAALASRERAHAHELEVAQSHIVEARAALAKAVEDERRACELSISAYIQAPGNLERSEDYMLGFAAGANHTADRNAAVIRSRARTATTEEAPDA